MAGNRKEYELLFKLQAALGGNFTTAFQSAINTTKQMQNSLTKLHSITGKIDAYKNQESALASNRQKLALLTEEHEKLQQEMRQTETPTEELRKKLEKNEKQIAATSAKIEEHRQKLNSLGVELSDAGVNTAHLSEENERLAKTYDKVKKSQEEVAKINTSLGKNQTAISQTKKQLTGTVGTIAALGTAIYAGPIKKSAALESQMSTVQAISGASAEDMTRLTKEAKRMGATTQFTAVEAGQALEYMAMAGWKTDQMMGGLSGIMNLSAASGEDLASVSDIVTDALTAFGMTADESGRFADVLAQASSNSNTTVAMMGSTFKKVAPIAGALGYSIEDMSLGIGLMANSSVKAEEAGTSLKSALANMAKPTKQMQTYMDKYGISLTNTDGSMKTFREVIDNLRSGLGGLAEDEQTAAATAIFGKESMAGMLAIVNASDEDFNKLSDSVNNATGAAARMAAIKLDNLEGDMILLTSAADALQTAIGDALKPTLREVVQQITEVVSKMALFADENQELVLRIAKVVTGLLAFKTATLTAKLGFLELRGDFLMLKKVMEVFKGKTALAGTETIRFSDKARKAAKGVTGYFGNIGNAAGGMGKAIGQAFGRTKIGGVVAKGLGKITPLLAPLKNLGVAIFGPFSGILGKIVPVIGVITLIVAAVRLLRENLDKVRAVIRAVFGDAGVEVFNKMLSSVSKIGNTIKGVFSNGNLGGVRKFLINLFGEGATETIDETIQTFTGWATTIASIVQGVATVISGAAGIVVQIIQFLMPTIQNIIGVALETISGLISGSLNTIKGIVDVFAGIFTGDWTRIWEGVKSIFSGVWTSIKSIASGALNGIIGMVNGVISGLNKLKIPDWVPGIGGKGGLDIPLIPKFAKGTTNTPDTFIAGEAGAELITNAKNRTVFTAAQTGTIFRNLAETANAIFAAGGIAQQPALAGVPSVAAPSLVSGMGGGKSVVIHSAPVFHVGNSAQAEDIAEMLRKHDEELLQEIDERERQRQEDERRRNYD